MSAPPPRPSSTIDAALARRRFGRAVATPAAFAAYRDAAILQREVARRMLERLDYVRLDPALVIDAGCGVGHALPGLRGRFPAARLLAVDFALPMLLRARAAANAEQRIHVPDWLRRLLPAAGEHRQHALAADFGRLPLRDASVDCIWSNLALHWHDDPASLFAEWHRVIKTGGLVQFSLLGPDTLRELRSACAHLPGVRVHPFIDMHDIGDMLVHAGFADPVMDMEVITLTYRTTDQLLAELRALGAANASAERPRGLTGVRGWAAMRAAYDTLRSDGTLPATFEIVYGHAWKPAPRAGRDGVAVVRVEDIGRRRR
ncbi:MAG: malonyl-ACP O-methyltransferase BioC [Betaproteobacteria bacterium]